MGTIIAKENILTTKKGVFAGGDAVTGSTTVISAMGRRRNCGASDK